MALLAWLLVSMILTLLWFRYASVLPVAAIALYLCIPFVAASEISGGYGHPATIVVLIALGLSLLVRPGAVFREIGDHPLLYLAGAALLGFLFVTLRFGASGATIPIDTIVAPLALLLIIRLSARWGDVQLPIRNTVITIAVAQVAISIATWVSGQPLLFADQFSRYYWFTPEFARAMGTTDHPLVLSLLLASTVPLLATLRSVFLQLSILAVLVVGLLLSESRTGLIAAVVGTAFLVFRKGRSFGARFAVIAGGVGVGIFLLQGPFASGIVEKFASDGGSTSVRFDALEAFFARWGEFVFLGWGNNGATAFRDQEGLRSSLESAFLIFSVNYGVVFTIGYFLLALIFIFVGRSPLGGSRLAALIALVVVQTFSSLATASASAMLLWAFVALASLSTNEPKAPLGTGEQSQSKSVPADRSRLLTKR